jgi:hypothetical protein
MKHVYFREINIKTSTLRNTEKCFKFSCQTGNNVHCILCLIFLLVVRKLAATRVYSLHTYTVQYIREQKT